MPELKKTFKSNSGEGIINAILRALILISILYINRIKSLIASGKKIIVSNLVIGFTIINIYSLQSKKKFSWPYNIQARENRKIWYTI